MIALITTALGVVAVLLELWARYQDGKDATYEALQSGRADITSGNTDAVSQRVDRLLADTAGTADNPAGIANSEDIEGRIRAL